jgi:CRISPR/Cas system-associated exonuclease Cas4 (RecB family)
MEKEKNSSFLEQLADYLLEKYGGKLGEVGILFPNRRAGVFFKNYISRKTSAAMWLPDIYTISGFMEGLSSLELADPLELSFEMYRVYSKLQKNPESFDEFFYWGEMMIADFDDIDKYLVDADKLFRNINDLKEIDNIFDYLSPDQKELISRFWRYFDKTKLSDHQESFLKIWKLLYPAYQELRKVLFMDNIAYEGMIYRDVAEKVLKQEALDLPKEKILICGFNALSKAEKVLFSHLKNSGRADFYWDYDQLFIEDKMHEAGRFLRENLKDFPADKDFDPGFNNLANKKNLNIYNLPSNILQSKKLYKILEKKDTAELSDFGDTAVILGDENMLQTVIGAIPPNIPNLNVTMGYALKNTPVYSFVDLLLQLQKNLSRTKSSRGFYFRDVLSVLNHQYIKATENEVINDFINRIHQDNLLYIKLEDFPQNELLKSIFIRLESPAEISDYLLRILDRISQDFIIDEDEVHQESDLQKEYIFQIKTRLNRLSGLFKARTDLLNNTEAYIRLFRKLVTGLRIPFAGEPLRGLQIMGILESRLLDFHNLIFLSMNEGVMPASHGGFTYIPANLRYALGMPTREDHDAIYAYYFFRLLQRAENISLLYNSSSKGMNTGEPTRYLYQLEYLSGYNIKKETMAFRVAENDPVAIDIVKDEAVMNKLNKFTTDGHSYLSPSALTSYMDCPLRFCFSYVEGVREEDEASEDVDVPGFGNLFHKAMELIYKEKEGSLIVEEDFKQLTTDEFIKEKLDQAFRLEFLKNDESDVNPEGRNIIVYEIIFQLIKQTLEVDKQSAPFTFRKAEQEVRQNLINIVRGKEIVVGGKIDRVDEREGVIHLIDYKTGKINLGFAGIQNLLDRSAWPSNDNMKGIVQVFIYSWLYSKQFADGKKITPGIYPTRTLYEKPFSFLITDKETKTLINSIEEYLPAIDEKIKDLIREIFDPATPFSQTQDTDRCKYCPYAGVCHREQEIYSY